MEESHLVVLSRNLCVHEVSQSDRGPLAMVRIFENLVQMVHFLEVKP